MCRTLPHDVIIIVDIENTSTPLTNVCCCSSMMSQLLVIFTSLLYKVQTSILSILKEIHIQIQSNGSVLWKSELKTLEGHNSTKATYAIKVLTWHDEKATRTLLNCDIVSVHFNHYPCMGDLWHTKKTLIFVDLHISQCRWVLINIYDWAKT